MKCELYEAVLIRIATELDAAERALTEIANENVYGDIEFLTNTTHIDDVTLYIHKAKQALRRAKALHIEHNK